jgi:hypothetical protein
MQEYESGEQRERHQAVVFSDEAWNLLGGLTGAGLNPRASS